MIIHIVRHAEAIERTGNIPEEHRFLTQRGRKRFRKIARSVRKLGIVPDLILTSPLIRAVQTADILAERLRYQGELEITPLLAPGFRPRALDELLAKYPQAQEITLVGHEPDLGIVTQELFASDKGCTLPKGAVVSFRKDPGEGAAEFLQMVTGGANIITSRRKALGRLQGETGTK